MNVDLASLQGVWTRRWIKWPDGRVDDTTRVFWLQANPGYGDIRIPASPGRSSDPEGFAGILRQVDNAWLWQRDFDYRPPTGLRDIGRLTFQNASGTLMLEEGVDAPYTELWEKIEDAGSDAFTRAGEAELLIAVGHHFILARGNGPGCEISHGLRNGRIEQWTISESTHPSREGQPIKASPPRRSDSRTAP